MDDQLETCGKLLINQGLTLAFAESATAGRMAADFSLLEEAGKFLKGGLVCYDAVLKETLLNVPEGLIKTFTPESMEVTRAIAHGLFELIPADLHIGITGLTSPGGSESPEKPVGTIFIHCLLYRKPLFSDRTVFAGAPGEIIDQTVRRTAELLNLHLPLYQQVIR
jgi:nicotinamide-nucleotide amidase